MTTLSFSLDRRVFVEEYWQRKPAVLKNVLRDWHSPLDPEDLAGLAMEADVDSRIVAGQAGVWSLAKGPFTATDFQRNGAWSLLVNAVDQWVPAVASLRSCVDFLPGWRFDDVMVSYATDGGSVGPHFDRYDVFLLQGQGHRLWRLGGHCDASTPCIDHEGLHLLENFTVEAEYLLEPGDALYLPPGIAHWGIARGECMTYSLGFRAPRVSDLVARMADDLLEKLDPDLLLEDKSSILKPPRPGELTADHLTNAREAVLNALIALDDGTALGELVTEVGEAAPVPPPLGDSVKCFPGARLLWQRYGDSCRVFANGEQLIVHGDCRLLLEALCRGATVSRHALQRADVELECLLILQGILIEAED